MSEQFHYCESAGRYVRTAVNRRYLTNTGFLLSLGVNEQEVTGESNASGVSWEARYRLLLPRSLNRSFVRHTDAMRQDLRRTASNALRIDTSIGGGDNHGARLHVAPSVTHTPLTPGVA